MDAVKDISISAGKAVNIVAANEVILKSETSIRIASKQGADVELKKEKRCFMARRSMRTREEERWGIRQTRS